MKLLVGFVLGWCAHRLLDRLDAEAMRALNDRPMWADASEPVESVAAKRSGDPEQGGVREHISRHYRTSHHHGTSKR